MDNNELGTNLASLGTDCISRQAAIDALKRKQDDGKGDLSRFYNTIIQHDIEAIKQLPPIQPKRGRWERHYTRPNVYADLFWHCSECGYKDSENYAPVYHHFCPQCGAKMEEVTT